MTRAMAISLPVVLLAACGSAAKNPERPAEPSPWQPPAAAAPAAPTAPAVAAKTEPSSGAVSKSAPSSGTSQNAGSTRNATTAASTPASVAAPKSNPSNAPAATVDDVKPVVPALKEPVIATVAGEPIYVSELLGQWLYTDPVQVREHLDNLTLHRLVVAEASRLGVRVGPDVLGQRYEAAVEGIETQIQRNEKRKGMKLDTFVDRVLGLDPIRYRERIREDALRTLLGERVARAWLLSSEHAWTHVIAVKTEDDVKKVQAELATGKPFEEVARALSIDESAKQGGKAPPVVKGDTAMGQIAFETEVGQVSAPRHEAGAWLMARVDERPKPLAGDWTVVGKAVEESLAKTPVDPLELAQWRAAMDKRYTIDPTPFLKLVGQ